MGAITDILLLVCVYILYRRLNEHYKILLQRWCSEAQCYGVVKVEKIGRWANKPFFVGALHSSNGLATNFEWDIQKWRLKIYRRKPEEGT